ncbi:protein translocase subunit SecF [Fodinicurvata sp. EGI_FJ10296]|uniref:protein translocase subunit SecF n=1 Tax=Fodinicurvata sp. EGI_FJ10296 TaxID=3231908 RepID=UPI0034545939
MKPLRIVPDSLSVNFIGLRRIAFAFSAVLVLLAIVTTAIQGLNFGIDFRGGTLLEVRTEEPADLEQMRNSLEGLGLGETSLQLFGTDRDVLIRIQRQSGTEEEQIEAIGVVQDALGDNVEYRRTEFVGPTVGDELVEAGTMAVLLSLAGILIYIWLRFEWQFGLCAVIALAHDVITTIGLFALIQFEFNLSTIAALLTIAGYSINDTVVVFDRVRENLRRYKKASLVEVLNRSINDVLSRTILTSVTTLLALAAIYVFGGAVIQNFAFALIWGILIGTYSSILLAVPLLLYMGLTRTSRSGEESDKDTAARVTGTAS